MLQKVTTAILPLAVLCLYSFILPRKRPLQFGFVYRSILSNIYLVISILVPALLTLLWIKYSDYLKEQNPLGIGFTSKNLAPWNFGTLEQRLSIKLWVDVIYDRNIKTVAAGFIGIALIIYITIQNKCSDFKKLIFLLTALFLLPFLIFTNLHIVHNYYQYSNSLFLSFALSLSIYYFCKRYLVGRVFLQCSLVLFFLISNYIFFYKDYYSDKTTLITTENSRILQVSKFIRENTDQNLPIIIFGYSWSSEIPFYSQRKAMAWINDGYDGFVAPIDRYEQYLTQKPGAVVLCPISNMELERKAVFSRFGEISPDRVQDCEIYRIN
jgi:hypothetical protein